MSKLYFAGSIRGGREDAALYRRIIQELGKYGDVLTEHVGDRTLTEAGQSNLSDRDIHDRDVSWIRSADVMIAETTQPSLGVGYEIAVAARHHIPIIALFRPAGGRKLSAMIAGCQDVDVINYSEEDIDKLFSCLATRLAQLL